MCGYITATSLIIFFAVCSRMLEICTCLTHAASVNCICLQEKQGKKFLQYKIIWTMCKVSESQQMVRNLNRSSQTVKKNKVMMGIRYKLDVIFQLPLAPDCNKSQGLTEQRRMCCLCFDIWKWLDFQFFLDKFNKPLALSPSCIFTVLVTRGL